ncbi:hypothetical protein GQR58_030345 [Nymphon striatum]|nr:hypothetical protein GQR58_030345 [Nymphon striatum]
MEELEDKDLVISLANTFLTELPRRIAVIVDPGSEVEEAQLAAHTLKSTSAMVGAEALRSVAAQIEASTRDGEPPRGGTMKGVIFNVVQEVVEELFDTDTWDDLLEGAEVDGAYTGDYADTELVAIVAQASKATGKSAEDVLRLVGYHGLPKLASRMPPSVTVATDAVSFIRQVNDLIHPEVLKIYPDAIPPAFQFEDHDDGIIVRYMSIRNLPALAEGLLSGIGLMFDAEIEVTRLEDDDETSARFLVAVSD